MNEKFFKLPQDVAARLDLPPGAKVLFAAILDRIGDNGDCWPGMRKLADDTGLSKDAVIENVARLKQKKLLVVRRGLLRGRSRQSQSNRYSLPSGRENRLVGKTDWSGMSARGSREKPPEPVAKTHHNQTQTREEGAAELRKDSTVTWSEAESRFAVSPELLERWRLDYPRLDVEGEIGKASAWHRANRKWKVAFHRALVSWLSRAQEQLGPAPAKPPIQTPAQLQRHLDELRACGAIT